MTMNTSACHPGEGSKALNRLPQLAEPLLQFDLQKELQQLRKQASWERETRGVRRRLRSIPIFELSWC
jgi:cytochrome c553